MSEVKKALIILCIWMVGCFFADYVFMFESRAYTMLWGFVVGGAGFILSTRTP